MKRRTRAVEPGDTLVRVGGATPIVVIWIDRALNHVEVRCLETGRRIAMPFETILMGVHTWGWEVLRAR